MEKPCITLRPETEWVETVYDGWNLLVGSDKEKIVGANTDYAPQGPTRQLYGEGNSAEKMVEIIGTSVVN